VFSWDDEFGDRFKDKVILVTGASGFIGSFLCRVLIELGAQVHALSRSQTLDAVPRDRVWQVDLTDLNSTQSAVSAIKPQLVYHLAGDVEGTQSVSRVLPTVQNNLLGTIHLLLATTPTLCECFISAGSSDEFFGDAPVSPYAVSKAAAAMYIHLFHKLVSLPVTVVRSYMGYGPYQARTKLIPSIILSLLNDTAPVLASPMRVCDLIYVADIVRGYLTVALQPNLQGKSVELGTGTGTTVVSLANLLAELTGKNLAPVFKTPDRVEEISRVASHEQIKQMLNWEPRWSLREGLIETVAWYQERVEHGRTIR
jgi:UDP-glucose 4-epimerase